jgi:ribonuclease HI
VATPPSGITIYVNSAIHAPPRLRKSAAAGVFYGMDDVRNKGFRIPVKEEQSPYAAEMYAALDAVRNTDTSTTLTITSNQNFIQKAMNEKLSTWEHEGWVNVRHREVLRCLAAEIKTRKKPTFFKVTEPGSAAREYCRMAMLLAKKSAQRTIVNPIDLSVPNGMALPGMSLADNRQRSFYRGIREEKTKGVPTRPATRKKLDLVQKAMVESFEKHVSDDEIWTAARGKDILPRSAQFLWRSLHNAHKIGHYWTHIPECEERAVCKVCGTEESLEHILTECESPGREIVWKEVENIWAKKNEKWPPLSLGGILGSGLAEFRTEDGKKDEGAERLYRILMSEAAYLIWRLRNERVIDRDGEPASEQEIINRWNYHINYRLQVDITLANRRPDGKKPALAPKKILDTWSGTLDDEGKMPANWLREPRVLVGSRATHSTRPNNGIG